MFRIRRQREGRVRELDKFLCFACEKYMGKMEWLADEKYADSPWAKDLDLPDSSQTQPGALKVRRTA